MSVFKRENGEWVKKTAFKVSGGAWTQTSSKEESVETAPIYGVSWVNDTSTTMTRTDDAVGMSYTGTSRIISDFDYVFPYNQMKRRVIDGNTFVYVPAMFFRVTVDENKKITGVAVSEKRGEGDGWYSTKPFYYGAYGASSDGTVLKSVSGASRQFSITRADARARAMAVGNGYHQRDLYAGTILMFLWWIEFATKDSSSVMPHAFSKDDVKTGNTDSFYSEDEGNLYVSGYDTTTSQMVWHGIEDYVGNGFEFEDGITGDGVRGGLQYVSDDYTLYDDYSGGSKMSALSFNSLSQTGGTCLLALGWDETKPFLCQPIEAVQDTKFTTAFCDTAQTTNQITSNRGSYSNTNAAGGVSAFRRGIISFLTSSVGCRLMLEVL